MGTTAEKLTYLNTTKQDLKTVINTTGAGLTDSSTFRSYANVLNDKILGAINGDVDLFEEYPKVSGNGTVLSLNGVVEGKMSITPQGVSSQESTSGKQLVNFNNLTSVGDQVSYTWQNDTLTVSNTSGTYRFVYVDLIDLFNNNQGKILRLDYDSIDFSQSNAPIVNLEIVNNGTTSYPALIGTTGNISIYAIPSDTSGITKARLRFMSNNSGTSQSGTIVINKPILHFGNVETSYEPYTGGMPAPNPSYPFSVKSVTGNNSLVITNSDNTQTQTYPLSLGNIELNSSPDGTIRDEIIGTLDNWVKREYIGKVVLNGTESGWDFQFANGWRLSINDIVAGVSLDNIPKLFSNYYSAYSQNSLANSQNYGITIRSSQQQIIIKNVDIASLSDFKTWLSTHNTTVWYQKVNYTDIQITDTTLISQLNNIYNNAHSYNGVTNITTTYENGNEQMYLDIEVLKNVWDTSL